MRLLVLGATGLLGQAICKEAHNRGYNLNSLARHNSDYCLDISDHQAFRDLLYEKSYDLVINCAALIDIALCTADVERGWKINARPCAVLADWSRETGRSVIHVSTDHYYTQGGSKAHNEDEPVSFINDYAMQKFAGERFILTAPNTLIFRTSIVGIRGWKQQTFAEWAISQVRANAEITLFSDAYSSSIDVKTFAHAAFDIFNTGIRGLFNLAAGEVYSKQDFIQEIATQLEITLTKAKSSKITDVLTDRANSLGLDVSRAQTHLDWRLPEMVNVVETLLNDEKNETFEI